MKTRNFLYAALCATLLLTMTLATTVAAPSQQPISFGMLMKPGFGGNGDALGVNYGAIFVLNCAYHKGMFPKLASATPLTTTQVITYWSGQKGGCASWLLKYPWQGGVPVPDGYQPPH